MAEAAAEKHIFAASGVKSLYSFHGGHRSATPPKIEFSATCESGCASGENTLLRSSVKLDEVAL